MFKRKREKRVIWARDLILCEIILVIALVAIPIFGAPLIPTDHPNGENYYAEDAYNENNGSRESVVIWVARGVGGFIDTYRDDIGAVSTLGVFIFTVVLAWSTGGLWRETEKLAQGADDQSEKMRLAIVQQKRIALANLLSAKAAAKAANAAELHARATVGAESPLLQITDFSTPSDAIADRERWVRYMIPVVTIKNFGRTTAVVTEVITNVHYGNIPTEPPELVRHQKYPVAVAIEPGKSQEFQEFAMRNAFTEEWIQSFLAQKEESAFAFGTIKYRDFSGIHEQGWLYIWIAASKHWSSFEQQIPYWKQT